VSTTNFSLTAATATTQDLGQAKSAQALSTLKSQLQPKNSDMAKIDKAGKDFESILLGEWLQKAEKSFATVPGADPDKDKDSGFDQFQSISCQFLGEGLSRAGGIGIASMISKHLKAIEAKRGSDENAQKASPEPVSAPPSNGK
jgi:Rod binding domain-containing protein